MKISIVVVRSRWRRDILGDLLVGTLDRIGAVADVTADGEGEVATDGAYR